jgi:membrane-bound lytic murein transglycosylase B
MNQTDLWAALVRALACELARELGPLLADALRAAPAPQVPAPADPEYLSVNETCARYGFSRGTFDRMLRDASSGLADVVVRVPPVTGRVKVPTAAFEAWLRARPQGRKSRRSRATS